jgi:hypothetical protein
MEPPSKRRGNSHAGMPPRSARAGAGSPGNLSQGPQRGIHGRRVRKQVRKLGIEDDDIRIRG